MVQPFIVFSINRPPIVPRCSLDLGSSGQAVVMKNCTEHIQVTVIFHYITVSLAYRILLYHFLQLQCVPIGFLCFKLKIPH